MAENVIETNVNETVTQPVDKTEEKTFTQKELNGHIENRLAGERKTFLSDLGIEDATSFKAGFSDYKKFQESQKTELEKAHELAKINNDKLELANKRIKEMEFKDNFNIIASEFNVLSKYKSDVMKLANLDNVYDDKGNINEKELKKSIEAVLKDRQFYVDTNDKPPKKAGATVSEVDNTTLPDGEIMKSFNKIRPKKK